MALLNKNIKRSAYLLIGILVVIQFIRPARNESNDDSNNIAKKYPVPAEVQTILRTSCYDCHSNHTDYPWYANIQPVAWWLANHVNEGKDELNFSEFAAYRPFRQYWKLDKLCKEIKEGEMPLSSYTLIHRHAIMNPEQIQIVTAWAQSIRDTMKATYPADSLAKPKKKIS